MKKITYSFCVLMTAGILMTSCGNPNASKEDTKEIAEDRNEGKFNTDEAEKNAQFLVDAATADYKEIEGAKVAANRAVNAEVKEVAKKIISEHESNLATLKQLAAAKSISIPATAPQEATDYMNKLNDTKAENFDKEYVDDLVNRHKNHINELEQQWESINDADIKDYISNSLSKLREHYDALVALQQKLK